MALPACPALSALLPAGRGSASSNTSAFWSRVESGEEPPNRVPRPHFQQIRVAIFLADNAQNPLSQQTQLILFRPWHALDGVLLLAVGYLIFERLFYEKSM